MMVKTSPQPANWIKRLLGNLIDGLILGFIIILLNSLIAKNPMSQIIISGLISFSYFVFFEYFYYNTIGKSTMKTTVISTKTNQQDVTLSQIIIRTLLRWIPFEAVSFISKNPFGMHDKYSETKVIDYNESVHKIRNEEALNLIKKLDGSYLENEKWVYILKNRILPLASLFSIITIFALKNDIFSGDILTKLFLSIVTFITFTFAHSVILLVFWISYQILQYSIKEKSYTLVSAIFIVYILFSLKISTSYDISLTFLIIGLVLTPFIGKILFPSNEKINEKLQ